MISEIAFINGVMALWQTALPLEARLDTITSEHNSHSIVVHAKWGNWEIQMPNYKWTTLSPADHNNGKDASIRQKSGSASFTRVNGAERH